MISSVAQSGFTSSTNGTALNTTQSESLLALLSNYDPKNLSHSDASDIVSGIREIGIKAGRGLGELLLQTGFKPGEIAQKAGVSRHASKNMSPPINMPSRINMAEPQDRVQGDAVQGDIVQGKNGKNTLLHPASMPPNSGFQTDALDALKALLEKYEDKDLSEDDWARLYGELKETGIDVSRPLLDILL